MTDSMKLTAPRHGLSLQFVTAEAAWIDWRELYQNGDEYDVFTPRPTYEAVRDYAPELLEEWQGRAESEAGDPTEQAELLAELEDSDKPLSDDHLNEFEQADRYDEWQDQFHPAMNYAWPVSMSYGGPSAEEAAALIDRFAGACCLVSFGEGYNPFGPEFASDTPEYGIALTGGGMDLSDRLAVAYLCCGCVPPERLLNGLDQFTGPARSGTLVAAADLLREAFDRAAAYFRDRAERLETTLGRLELDGEAE